MEEVRWLAVWVLILMKKTKLQKEHDQVSTLMVKLKLARGTYFIEVKNVRFLMTVSKI